MGLMEEVEAMANFVRSAVDGTLRGTADELVDAHRLELAFHANEIELAENEAVALGGGVRSFVDQDMRAVVLVQPSRRDERFTVSPSAV